MDLVSSLFVFTSFVLKSKIGIGDVLVIGAGPSGIDLAMRLTKVAKTVSISRNKPSNGTFDGVENQNNAIPPNVTLKDRVKRLTADGVEFTTGE